MKRSVAMALACLLAVQAVAATRSGYNTQGGSSGRKRKLLQGGGGSGGGASGSGTGSGSGSESGSGGRTPSGLPPSAGLFTTVSVGDRSVQCDSWSNTTGTWITPRNATEWRAPGRTQPQASQVSSIESQICSNATSAAKALLQALKSGGSQAEAWVYALFNANCSAEAADTYQIAIDQTNTGDPANLPATQQFFTAFVKAANATGIPVCATVALVDEDTGEVIRQFQYHTGGGAGGATSGGGQASSGTGGGTAGSGTGSGGGGAGGATSGSGTGAGGSGGGSGTGSQSGSGTGSG